MRFSAKHEPNNKICVYKNIHFICIVHLPLLERGVGITIALLKDEATVDEKLAVRGVLLIVSFTVST